MKVLFWSDGFWPRIGGRETQAIQFLDEMKKRGHQCLVLAQKDSSHLKEDDFYNGIPVKRFDFTSIVVDRDLKIIPRIKQYLNFVFEEFKPDIIYLNALDNGSAFVFSLFRSTFSVPIVLTVHAPYFDSKFPSIIEKICSQVDFICCGSKWGTEVMQKLLPACKDRIRTIYYGLSWPKLLPASHPLSSPVILLLGRLSAEKGFETGIEAFSFLKKCVPTAQLLIAGSGPERSYLEHLVDQHELTDCTEFSGEIAVENVYEVINQATFVVMPSYFEAFGLVALESLQMQRPVIASNVGGLPEVISEHGILISPKDSAACFSAMKFLLDNPIELTKMGKNGREWAKYFSVERNVDQYIELFEECLSLKYSKGE